MFNSTPRTKALFVQLAEAKIPAADRGTKVEWPLLQFAAQLEEELILAGGQDKLALMAINQGLQDRIRKLEELLRYCTDYVRIQAAEEIDMNKYRTRPRNTEQEFLNELEATLRE